MPTGMSIKETKEVVIMARGPFFRSLGGHHGYWVLGTAVAGSSDCGDASDSPAPSDKVAQELRRFQRECLRPAGIKSRTRWSESTNCFMLKRWVCVARKDLEAARLVAQDWFAHNDKSCKYIHLP